MYLTDILRRSGRSLKQAKARTLLTAVAIAVGTFALTLTLVGLLPSRRAAKLDPIEALRTE
jgi:ABC-type antimicrobial peptide transport system permease subunit